MLSATAADHAAGECSSTRDVEDAKAHLWMSVATMPRNWGRPCGVQHVGPQSSMEQAHEWPKQLSELCNGVCVNLTGAADQSAAITAEPESLDKILEVMHSCH